MQKIIKLLFSVMLIFSCWQVYANKIYQDYHFDNRIESERFDSLLDQFRCMVCQNQSLADSDAVLAQDLRQKIYELMQANYSDTQIVSYLTQRYGEFILLSPPVTASTYLLWIGPFILLLICSWLGYRMIARSHQRYKAQL